MESGIWVRGRFLIWGGDREEVRLGPMYPSVLAEVVVESCDFDVGGEPC